MLNFTQYSQISKRLVSRNMQLKFWPHLTIFPLQLGRHANQTLFTSLLTLDRRRRNNSFLWPRGGFPKGAKINAALFMRLTGGFWVCIFWPSVKDGACAIDTCSGPNGRLCVYLSFRAEPLVHSQFVGTFVARVPPLAKNNTLRTWLINQHNEWWTEPCRWHLLIRRLEILRFCLLVGF